jgi:hypothetical protein
MSEENFRTYDVCEESETWIKPTDQRYPNPEFQLLWAWSISPGVWSFRTKALTGAMAVSGGKLSRLTVVVEKLSEIVLGMLSPERRCRSMHQFLFPKVSFLWLSQFCDIGLENRKSNYYLFLIAGTMGSTDELRITVAVFLCHGVFSFAIIRNCCF